MDHESGIRGSQTADVAGAARRGPRSPATSVRLVYPHPLRWRGRVRLCSKPPSTSRKHATLVDRKKRTWGRCHGDRHVRGYKDIVNCERAPGVVRATIAHMDAYSLVSASIGSCINVPSTGGYGTGETVVPLPLPVSNCPVTVRPGTICGVGVPRSYGYDNTFPSVLVRPNPVPPYTWIFLPQTGSRVRCGKEEYTPWKAKDFFSRRVRTDELMPDTLKKVYCVTRVEYLSSQATGSGSLALAAPRGLTEVVSAESPHTGHTAVGSHILRKMCDRESVSDRNNAGKHLYLGTGVQGAPQDNVSGIREIS